VALLARERVDLPNNRPVVLQQRPLDEYSKCIYTLLVITWDEAKRRANLRKHGFDFVDAEEVFPGVTYTYEDDRLAYGERRFVTLGLLREIVVSIVHTEDGDHVHVISMRKATKREREIYFESIAN
jgi:uncharacterized DUF497 family protein